MSQADLIRAFVADRYIGPARARSAEEVTVRAGDVHAAMKLANRMPAVCSAIGSLKFLELAGVSLIQQSGPANGANVFFRFRVGNSPTPRLIINQSPLPDSAPLDSQSGKPVSEVVPREKHTRTGPSEANYRDALVLISCVKTKAASIRAARDLYTSDWFRKARALVENRGSRWLILSAKYGLLEPHEQAAPYEHTLNTLGVAERREWARRVLAQLDAHLSGTRRVVFFAGARYREFLVAPLMRRGITVEIPMEHLAQGEQLSWLGAQAG